ncbi:aldehyde dehydrogenase family protein [Amnibacterium sp. CER49]|uniref:aldehyde dehydrogenase family protein n=1 Tax=Amnibacterium sp. CER49 TaxID=3039161 RepID=UPI00244BA2A6|nr:aldehyde dehydrogenase family protein [Amnibacterium sp. CER49]MDH2443376.1 aldehyde dehydrogenase family protein [Amnibacterium sp. CER49]
MALLDLGARSERLFLAGEWTTGSGVTRDVVCPSDGSSLGTVGLADASDVDRAVRAARRAQPAWAAAPFDERAAVLRRAAALLEANADEYAGLLVGEAGSARGKAAFEVGLVVSELHFAAALALAPTGQVLRTAKPRLSLAQRVPVGVVGVISPFNFPGILSTRSVAPALALGNAVVLKPDPRTAVTGGLFLAELLAQAGLPAGVLSVLPGGAEAGGALVEHPDVRVISFTGSTAAGRRVGEQAGRLLKRAHLELGGNNALVVLDDVDVDAAVSAGAWGSFLHQGQICMTAGRHLVHASVYDRYVDGLAASADRLPVGDPRSDDVALGPIIDAHQRDHVHELVTASVDAGARLAAGGTYDELFYRPTVLAEVRPDHRAFAEEVFGPVAPVLRFESEDELVDVVNRSEYGLSLGILTRDVMRGLSLAERLPSGIVHINDQTVDDESVAPFGGVAASGTGVRFGGFEANAEAFTETRWITAQGSIERYPF